ncbi:hypothetical protein ACFV9J_30315, partial [Streptomyces sp. NPDC059906]
LGAGQGPRAALPGRDAGGRPGAPGGARGPQSPAVPGQQNRPAPAGAGAGAGAGQQAPGAPQGLQAAGMNAPQGNAPANNASPGQDMFGGNRTPGAPPQRKRGGNGDAEQGRRPQLPPRGGPRAELPGGNPQPRVPSWSDENAQPPVERASLDAPRGHDEPDSSRTDLTPRLDERQGPGSTAEMPAVPRFGEPQSPAATAEFARPDFDAPAPRRDESQDTGQYAQPGQNQYDARNEYEDQYGRQDQFGQQGQYGQDQYAPGQYGQAGPGQDQYDRPRFGQDAPQNDQFARPEPAAPQQDGGAFVRSDVFGGQPAPNGQAPADRFAASQGYDSGSTGRHDLPGRQDPAATGQFERPQAGGTQGGNDFGAPRPPAPQRPVPQEPAGQNTNGTSAQRPGDGWALPPASGPGDGRTPLYDTLETNWFHGDRESRAPQAAPAASPEPQAAQPQTPAAPQRPATSAWRSSPNDDLVRQAERVRQPAAGGVTTSGLPRRVPRANLVPGTAQQQSHQSGPAVSRAPDDVRGRLTNLRRGIAQGRQAGTNQTGSYPRPTHQQER